MKSMHPGMVILFIITFSFVAEAQQNDVNLSEEAEAYIEEAIALMQEYSYRSSEIDWDHLRQEVLKRAAGAQTSEDTYKALQFGVSLLADRHSRFIPPKKQVQGDEESTGQPEKRKAVPLPKVKMLEGGIAYIWVPWFASGETARMNGLAQVIQAQINMLQQYDPKGWIVDLRDNGGGNMWPMVAGLGPLLGEGLMGSFTFRGVTLTSWHYEDGSVLIKNDGEVVSSFEMTDKLAESMDDSASIAVLIGPDTGSSGEATLVAFLGKPNVRTFGMPTYGVPTANRGHTLSDGATLLLAVSFFSDRLGREYHGSIPPDSYVRFNPFNTEKSMVDSDDPVIEAAAEWIIGSGEDSQ